jgi:hypothetical protein
VRVRDRDRSQAAGRLDVRADLVVEERDAVPQDVPAGRADEQRALADREARLAADPDEAWRLLADLGAVVAPELAERRPALAVPADVLALVFADGAARRRLGAFRELDPAGDADEMQLGAPQPDHPPQQTTPPLLPLALLAAPALELLDARERSHLQFVDSGLGRPAVGRITRHLDPLLASAARVGRAGRRASSATRGS